VGAGETGTDTTGSIGQLQIIAGGGIAGTAVLLSATGVPVVRAGGVTGGLTDRPGGSAFCIPGDEPVLMQALVRRQRIIMAADKNVIIIFFWEMCISMDMEKQH
jgi:hypothetical protein